MAMYDNDLIAKNSFNLNYISSYLQHAQWAEMLLLEKLIIAQYNKTKKPVTILDIGIGNARVPLELSKIAEVWNKVEKYVGVDNAQNCIDAANKNIKLAKQQSKITVQLIDAKKLNTLNQKFDFIFITWFTAGNFAPKQYNLSKQIRKHTPLDLSSNDSFTQIIKSSFGMLHPKGKLVLGALYKNSNETRLKQEAAYQKMGMQVITLPTDDYTATKQGFWSQRFTKQLLYNYVPFVPKKNIVFKNLDGYNFAMQVQITK